MPFKCLKISTDTDRATLTATDPFGPVRQMYADMNRNDRAKTATIHLLALPISEIEFGASVQYAKRPPNAKVATNPFAAHFAAPQQVIGLSGFAGTI